MPTTFGIAVSIVNPFLLSSISFINFFFLALFYESWGFDSIGKTVKVILKRQILIDEIFS